MREFTHNHYQPTGCITDSRSAGAVSLVVQGVEEGAGLTLTILQETRRSSRVCVCNVCDVYVHVCICVMCVHLCVMYVSGYPCGYLCDMPVCV